MMDETIACFSVFNMIETRLMNLEATILEIKLKFESNIQKETKSDDSDVKKVKLLFLDAENKISFNIKSINEKDLDLDRKDVF